MTEHIVAVVVAAIMAAGTIGAAVVAHRRARDEKRATQPARAVLDHVRIYDILSALRFETGARRVAVVRTHNGGGVPSARVPLYSSALYEVVADGAEPLRDIWQALPVAESYLRVLAEMLDTGEVQVRPGDLAGSRLGFVYEAGGTRTAFKALASTDPESLYYLSVQFGDESHTLAARERLAIDHAVREIRSALAGPHTANPTD